MAVSTTIGGWPGRIRRRAGTSNHQPARTVSEAPVPARPAARPIHLALKTALVDFEEGARMGRETSRSSFCGKRASSRHSGPADSDPFPSLSIVIEFVGLRPRRGHAVDPRRITLRWWVNASFSPTFEHDHRREQRSAPHLQARNTTPPGLSSEDAFTALPSGDLAQQAPKLFDRVRLVQQLEAVGAILREHMAVARGEPHWQSGWFLRMRSARSMPFMPDITTSKMADHRRACRGSLATAIPG